MSTSITTRHGEITFRNPTRDEWKRHISMLASGARAEAEDYLFETCCTSHDAKAVAAMLDISPGLPGLALTPIHAACGVEEAESSGTATLDAAARQALRDKCPRGVCFVETVHGTAAFTALDRIQRRKDAREMVDPNLRGEALEFRALATVVHPDRETFKSWLESTPAIPSAAGAKIIATGSGAVASEGKE